MGTGDLTRQCNRSPNLSGGTFWYRRGVRGVTAAFGQSTRWAALFSTKLRPVSVGGTSKSQPLPVSQATRFFAPYIVTRKTNSQLNENHEKISVCSVGSCSCFPASIAIRDSLYPIRSRSRFVTFVNFCKISLSSVVSRRSSVFCHPSSET